jgi:uncharacterized protein YjbI with pentapeptide repeats
MGKFVERPPIKPRSSSAHQGLRKLSPDLISKARDETNTQVTRIGLTFVGTAAFCLLSLRTPDSALLGDSEKINMPFAGPVSFFGFMLLGPTVLIVLRVYLQIYVEHGDRLDRLARSMSIVRAPTLIPLQNPLVRLFSGSIFYALLPVVMMCFAWKAAVFPAWGSGLFVAAVAVTASHVTLPSTGFSWREKRLLTFAVALIIVTMVVSSPLHRQFDLYHENLSGHWLSGERLAKANLSRANLSHANLTGAVLSGADLSGADLSGADLHGAYLIRANLSEANLSGAKLVRVTLRSASLSNANLSGVDLFAAIMSGADLLGANLGGAKLRAANLRDANLSYANLSSADLSGAILVRASLQGANLSEADLTDAFLNGADLLLTDLSGADLRFVQGLAKTENLFAACGEKTKLPEDFTVAPCPPSDKK